MRSHKASLADVLGMGKSMLNGMQAHEADMKAIGLDPVAFGATVDRFVLLEGQQEKLKGDLHAATDVLYAAKKDLQHQLSSILSMLEGKYGKSSPKLEDFGIAPRQVNPHRGPRVKANTTATNTPANNKTSSYTNQPANGTPASYNPPNNPPQPSAAA